MCYQCMKHIRYQQLTNNMAPGMVYSWYEFCKSSLHHNHVYIIIYSFSWPHCDPLISLNYVIALTHLLNGTAYYVYGYKKPLDFTRLSLMQYRQVQSSLLHYVLLVLARESFLNKLLYNIINTLRRML